MRQRKSWLITDTHFKHLKLENEGYRPKGFTIKIQDNWKRLVGADDLVFHLGDVILGENGTLGEILASLPGIKFLVRGNHDLESNGWYMRQGFSFVAHGILHGGAWLTHAPQATLPDGAILNIHGHLHDRPVPEGYPAHCKRLAMEFTDYCPVEFDKFTGFTPMRKLLLNLPPED